MADPLSISASIAGLLSLAGTVIANGYIYINTAKEHPKALAELLRAVSELNIVLSQVNGLVNMNPTVTAPAAIASSSPMKNLTQVVTPELLKEGGDLLQTIQNSLNAVQRVSGEGVKNFGKAVIWPFKEREVKALLERIRALVKTLIQLINVDSRWVCGIPGNNIVVIYIFYLDLDLILSISNP